MLLLLEGRAVLELGAFFAAAPWLRMTARGDGHPVLVLPGLGASDVSTRPLRSFLAGRGYAVHGWGRGRNLGRRNMVDLYLVPRLKDLRQRYDRRVSVIGWSLGGIYARELAKRAPDDVRLVITLGSPFAGNPKASNVWRLFEASSGRKVDDDPEARRRRREPPPVPTTAIFSRTDGIVAWQRCTEQEGARIENIEVQSSHCGLGHHPAVLYAIADRLAQPEGEWRPFERSGLKRLLYPDPRRGESPGA